jgi:orotate phosphoribosyltransferase
MSPASSFHDERLPDPRPKDPDADVEVASLSRALASDLLTIGAVVLQPGDPFTWSSGLRAPLYCDNRRTLGVPRIRQAICDGFAALVEQHDLLPATLAGTATAGIPHAAWLANRVNQPMAYVRSSAKSHGRQKQVEGIVEAGDPVVVVEDLISTGGSALQAVQALREVGADVRAVLAIFSYEFDTATAAFRNAAVPLHPLTGYRTLIDVARAQDEISDDALATLQDWRRDPEAWSEQHAAR